MHLIISLKTNHNTVYFCWKYTPKIDGDSDAVPEDFNYPEIFEVLKALDMKKFNPRHSEHLEFTRQRKKAYKVANARNPFSR